MKSKKIDGKTKPSKTNPKLRLHRETVRRLDKDELEQVVGGLMPSSHSDPMGCLTQVSFGEC